MSGHSKWANIKHRKEAQDAKKSKFFQKLIKEIYIAVRQSNGDANPKTNMRLKLAIEKAKSANMNKDTIDKAIKKASGQQDTSGYKTILYEGYGPNGTAILVDCLTDNRNRTTANVRSCFNRYHGSLGTKNSVAHLFNRVAQIGFEHDHLSEDEALEWAVANDAINFHHEDNTYVFTLQPEKLNSMQEFLEGQGITHFVINEILMLAQDPIKTDETTKEKVEKLVDMLEDDEDVQNVYTNLA